MSADALQDNLCLEDYSFQQENDEHDDQHAEQDNNSDQEHIDMLEDKGSKDKGQQRELEIKDIIQGKALKYIGVTDLKSINPKESTLIISSSAIKCTKILSDLSYLKKKIGKLFAKHLKFNEQLEQLQQEPRKINVGTPNRILKLWKFLKTKKLKVIIDMSKDLKGFSILDIKDTRKDLLHLLDNLSSSDCKCRVFILSDFEDV